MTFHLKKSDGFLKALGDRSGYCLQRLKAALPVMTADCNCILGIQLSLILPSPLGHITLCQSQSV